MWFFSSSHSLGTSWLSSRRSRWRLRVSCQTRSLCSLTFLHFLYRLVEKFLKKTAAGVLQKCLNLFLLLVPVPSFIKHFHPPVFMHMQKSFHTLLVTSTSPPVKSRKLQICVERFEDCNLPHINIWNDHKCHIYVVFSIVSPLTEDLLVFCWITD